MAEKKLLIVLTEGPDDRGNRATLAFSMGSAALFSGVGATIYMTMGGTFWSREKSWEQVQVEGFEPLAVYVDRFCEAGGRVLVCSRCDESHCALRAQDDALMKGAELCGLSHIVDLALDSSVITL